MDESSPLNDLHFLRDVVARTQPPAVNRFWSVTLMWGCVVTVGFLTCALLGIEGKTAVLPWVMPGLILLVAYPLHWYLRRRVRLSIEESGVRPRFRRDLMWCWISVSVMGLLWTAGLIVSGLITSHGYLLIFAWCSLLCVGYVMNGVLLSKEWFWAAGVMLASIIAAFLAGYLTKQPDFYWFAGYAIPVTYLLAGILGRRNARSNARNQIARA
jgi:hypothetical protein